MYDKEPIDIISINLKYYHCYTINITIGYEYQKCTTKKKKENLDDRNITNIIVYK